MRDTAIETLCDERAMARTRPSGGDESGHHRGVQAAIARSLKRRRGRTTAGHRAESQAELGATDAVQEKVDGTVEIVQEVANAVGQGGLGLVLKGFDWPGIEAHAHKVDGNRGGGQDEDSADHQQHGGDRGQCVVGPVGPQGGIPGLVGLVHLGDDHGVTWDDDEDGHEGQEDEVNPAVDFSVEGRALSGVVTCDVLGGSVAGSDVSEHQPMGVQDHQTQGHDDPGSHHPLLAADHPHSEGKAQGHEPLHGDQHQGP